MAGFILKSDPQNTGFELVGMNNTTAAVGDLFCLAVGATYYTLATDSGTPIMHWSRKAVVTEAVTTASDYAKVIPVNVNQVWEAESANNSNASHNGDRMIITDQNTINNTGTDSADADAVVVQVGTIGAVSDKRILVKFLVGSGANPDAT